jgi:hypothetical protein
LAVARRARAPSAGLRRAREAANDAAAAVVVVVVVGVVLVELAGLLAFFSPPPAPRPGLGLGVARDAVADAGVLAATGEDPPDTDEPDEAGDARDERRSSLRAASSLARRVLLEGGQPADEGPVDATAAAAAARNACASSVPTSSQICTRGNENFDTMRIELALDRLINGLGHGGREYNTHRWI